MPLGPYETAAMLLAAATLPSVLYVVILRNSERVGRESWGSILYALFYGAVISVLLVTLFQIVLGGAFNRFLRQQLRIGPQLVAVVVAAPLVEELFKGFGLRKTRHQVVEVEDGIVFAAAIALGFAATENLLYQLVAYCGGSLPGLGACAGLVSDWWGVVVARSVSSTLLHPTATGILGLGYGKVVVQGKSRLRLLPYYGGAVAMHAVYNYAAVTGLVIVPGVPLHLPVAVILAIVGFVVLRQTILRWDRRSAPAA